MSPSSSYAGLLISQVDSGADPIRLGDVATVTVRYAKAHLSALLKAIELGEEIFILRGDNPVARLTQVTRDDVRDLGFLAYTVPDLFFEPLLDVELAGWDGSA